MTKADIIAMVGQSQYDEASAILRKLTPGPDPTVQHVVSPAVWESHLPQVEQLALFFELYDDLPSYGMLMYATHAYPEFDERSREVWWGYCLKRICSGNEVVSEPILRRSSVFGLQSWQCGTAVPLGLATGQRLLDCRP